MEYLDFELPIKELKEQLEKCYEIGVDSDVDVIATCKKIEKKLEKTKKESEIDEESIRTGAWALGSLDRAKLIIIRSSVEAPLEVSM